MMTDKIGTISFNLPAWGVEQELGYKPITTFWQDFSMAERFGLNGVKSTFKTAFKEWRSNYKYLTELVMVLNHNIWQHYGNGPQDPNHNGPLAKLYNDLWAEADIWAGEHLKGEELDYFIRTLD